MWFASLAHLAEGGDCDWPLVLQTDVKMAAPFGEPQSARVPTELLDSANGSGASEAPEEVDRSACFWRQKKERKNLLGMEKHEERKS
jgi:hypothetical protein